LRFSRGPSLASDEEKIILYSRDLSEQLGVPELKPQNVSWSPWSLILVLSDSVRLPKRMRGRLTPEEWKPLIASSIIHQGLVADARHKKFNDKKLVLTHFFPQMLVPTLLLDGVILLSFRVNGVVYRYALLVGGLAGWLAFVLPMMRRFLFVTTKDLQFRADREAADIVGKETLLVVLEKIGGMELDRHPRFDDRWSLRPSTRQRIEKLQNYSTYSGQELR
jgi:hypothetical protein